MKTTIRIFQPWTACLLLICGCLSAFGQSTPNFNVTVTETSASGCGECLNLFLQPIIDPTNEMMVIDPCLDSPSGPLIISYINTNFNISLNLSESELNDNIVYKSTGKVYYEDLSGNMVPIQVVNNSGSTGSGIASMFGTTTYGNLQVLSSEDDYVMHFHIPYSIVDPGLAVADAFHFEFVFTPGYLDEDVFVPVIGDPEYGEERIAKYIIVPRCNVSPIPSGRNSFENPLNTNSIKIYPNPTTSDAVVVEAQLAKGVHTKAQDATLEIFNLQGQRIKSLNKIFLDDQGKMMQRVDIATLPKGIYILEISSLTSRTTAKLIKQ